MNQRNASHVTMLFQPLFRRVWPFFKRFVPSSIMERAKQYRKLNGEEQAGSSDAVEIIRLQQLPRLEAGTTVRDGQVFHFTDAKTYLHEYHQIFCNRCYDFPCSTRSPRIIDCGANVGMACRYWLMRYPEAHITAFEPDPVIFEVLKNNLSNVGAGHVDLHQAALWRTEAAMSFISTGDESGHLSNSPSDSRGSKCTVSTKRLSTFLESEVDFLKIDVEGAEVDILIEAKEKLANVKAIWLEYHSYINSPQRLSEALKVLEQNGFRYHIVTESVSLKPLEKLEADYGMDQRLNVWAVRGNQFPNMVEIERDGLGHLAGGAPSK